MRTSSSSAPFTAAASTLVATSATTPVWTALTKALPVARTVALMVAVAACSEDDQTLGPTGGAPDAAAAVDAGPADTGVAPDSGEPNCAERPTEAPSLRSESSLVYDPVNDRLLMYGGNVAEVICGFFSREPIDDLWAFELDCNNWRRLTPAGGPSARVRHAATVDTTRSRMIIFGGREGTDAPYTFLNDVWAFDLATETWTEIPTAGVPPSLRDDTVLEYDAGRDRIVLFGGDSDRFGTLGGRRDDMFALDLATGIWSEIVPAGPRPAARLLHASANLGDRMVIFGGAENFDVYRNDVWIFDFVTETWAEVAPNTPASGPLTRFGPALFVDPTLGRAISFAGHDLALDTPPGLLGNRNDTWQISLAGGQWGEISAGDVYNPDARPPGRCDFPPDFTIADLDSPDRRSAFPYAQSGEYGFIFGGNTDCGRANDVWSYDLTTNQWRELRAANGGIACIHSGQIGCTTLCF